MNKNHNALQFFLGLLRESLNPFILTGADDVDRGLNSGTQVFDTDKSKWPLYQPVPKVESYPQVSGSASFLRDRITFIISVNDSNF